MKRDILEQIIKVVLSEQTTIPDDNITLNVKKQDFREKKFILTSLSNSKITNIINAGGITGFNIKLKFAKFPSKYTDVIYNTITDYIYANRQIGTRSKFASIDSTNNQPRYMYIYNNLDISRTNRVANCVVTVLLYSPIFQLASEIDKLNQNDEMETQLTRLNIGITNGIPIYTINDMSKFIASLKARSGKLELVDNKLKKKIKFPNLAAIGNITPPQEEPQSNDIVDKQVDSTPAQKTVMIPADSTDQKTDITPSATTNTSADNVTNASTSKNNLSVSDALTYPYTITSGSAAGNVIYTMSDTDPWVYVKVNNEWYTAKKSEFEVNQSTGDETTSMLIPKSNTAAYNKLNALIK
jgi:hypothetical protein